VLEHNANSNTLHFNKKAEGPRNGGELAWNSVC